MKNINMIGSTLSSLSRDAMSAEDQAKNDFTDTRYGLSETPMGKHLFTYWLAVLSVLGAFTEDRREFKSGIAARFFRSPTAINYHRKQGNIEATRRGHVRLTVKGLGYFQARVKGHIKGQEVDLQELRYYTAVVHMGMRAKDTKLAESEGRLKGLRESDLKVIDISR